VNTTDSLDDIEVESRLVKAARLTFLGSLLFWPLFVFSVAFTPAAPGKSIAAEVERTILVYCIWLYPVAVALGWFLSKRGLRLARPDIVCLLPWLIPALVFCYWLVYFLL
jgi:hypothetical protein